MTKTRATEKKSRKLLQEQEYLLRTASGNARQKERTLMGEVFSEIGKLPDGHPRRAEILGRFNKLIDEHYENRWNSLKTLRNKIIAAREQELKQGRLFR